MYPELRQVFWYSGVYLQPQHFQALDLHHSYMLSRNRQLSQPWNFGVINLEIDIEKLCGSTIEIESLQVILPSGDYLEYPGNCVIPPINFNSSLHKNKTHLTFWLALRRFDPSYSNVGDKPNNRWKNMSDEEMMKDVYSNGPECSISQIVYNAQIICEDEKNTMIDCEFLPLLRVSIINNSISLDKFFCPPLLEPRGSQSFIKLLESIYIDLKNRGTQLEEYNDAKRFDKLRNEYFNRLIAICSLKRNMALFSHYYSSHNIHPWVIYGVLLQLIGELSVLSNVDFDNSLIGGEAQYPLLYDHYNIHECFSKVQITLKKILNGICLDINTYAKLKRGEHGIFYAEAENIDWDKFNIIFLSIYSEQSPFDAPPDSSTLKLSSSNEIKKLIKHALPGISMSNVDSIPVGIPHKDKSFYFKVNKESLMINRSIDKSEIAFYWSESPDDLQVQLICMEEK
ncbi:type VI secretion system baseplate subunit TssK [Hafnia paralvei]|uniref:type VI secretion system baseplate subunit TssK n=1 Tax=Hafnia paralvei TaxID=546367 RepID=UPI000DF3A0D6|nr:type VI secretion system baseplate subunit TssK [Hafnia paralvei]RDA61911.1 type VI secretion system baseplate subunit TssK [Hafnia paralvei]RDA62972.1 type VI secretion system baseplate subunit TssK [Hafnia paralvei]RDA63812.1 type VI secretion system baseplate subunit TssK [Hafnia paralvei]RDA75098.1 type VI secretion system baseplate subunit TssK [Hafnia paralvei]RDA75502.1 type VI secretion system baseplate subunit TssK [Hafnia paralvei]